MLWHPYLGQDLDKGLVSGTFVEVEGFLELDCELQLLLEPQLLDVLRAEVAVKVQAALSNRHHVWVAC